MSINRLRYRSHVVLASVILAVLLQHGTSFTIHRRASVSSSSSLLADAVSKYSLSTIPVPINHNHGQPRRQCRSRLFAQDDIEDNDEEDDGDNSEFFVDAIGGIDSSLSQAEVQKLTVPQLKQQLRLRGLKVSGRKKELVDRLLALAMPENNNSEDETPQTMESMIDAELLSEEESLQSQKVLKSMAQAKADGKEFIDVTAYVDPEDAGMAYKTVGKNENDENYVGTDVADGDGEDGSSSGPETWGSSAKIVDDYDGRTPIVDGLSRTIIEYRGSNQTMVKAYVVASRDALKPFLDGGLNRTNDAEARVLEIQQKRETAARRPVKFEDTSGLEEGDETGLYKDILHRDFSDWGKFSVTGAQLSAQEVQGVIFLSDVYGAFNEDTKMLAEKIAFECQPIVVMVPDLFRGNPWLEDKSNPGHNAQGLDYEQWRKLHPDQRVSIDIRSAASVLRRQYGVSTICVWGTCYGGGRALEVGAGYLPDDQVHDIDGRIGPPSVEPSVVVAWYPTRYNVKHLYGKNRRVETDSDGRKMAVMAVFGENDELMGATTEDAKALKAAIQEDDRVKDLMVKVFPNQGHGFAHVGISGSDDDEDDFEQFVDDEFGGAGRISMNDGEAEVACLLSTAFMETYSRIFLPTTGPPISLDESESAWGGDLNMKNLDEANTRDVRKEIEDSLENFVEQPLQGKMIDRNDDSQRDELAAMLRNMEPKDYEGPFKIKDDDSLEMIYTKLKGADPTFQIF